MGISTDFQMRGKHPWPLAIVWYNLFNGLSRQNFIKNQLIYKYTVHSGQLGIIIHPLADYGGRFDDIGPGSLRAPCMLACAMHNWPLLLPSFSLSFFLSFSLLRLLLFTYFEETPVCEITFAPIFWHKIEDKCKKKYFWGVNFIFLRKKADFRPFFCFLWPVFWHGHLGHPQSLEYSS